jgi:phage shock protein E
MSASQGGDATVASRVSRTVITKSPNAPVGGNPLLRIVVEFAAVDDDRELVPRDLRPQSGHWLVLGLVLAGVVIVLYFALGMPGMTHGPSGGGMASMSGESPGSSGPAPSLPYDEFAARMKDPGATVINVHIPFAGALDGTDASIPYDQISSTSPGVPSALDSEILLYCRTGRMSAIAATSLRNAGYTNVFDLAGGMEAWEAAGHPLRWSPPLPADAPETNVPR